MPNIAFLVATTLLTVAHGQVLGTHKWAAVLLDYCDDAGEGECDRRRPAGEMMSLLKTRYNSPVEYFDDASYGKFHVDLDVFGWIQPTSFPLDTEAGYGYEACFPADEHRFRILKDYDSSIALGQYDGFVFIIRRPKNVLCSSAAASGYGAMPRTTYTTPATIVTRIVMMGSTIHPENYSGISSSSMVHEMLHTYGLQHVDAVRCEGGKVVDVNGGDCAAQLFGGLFSIMGLRQFASRPNPVNLDNLGWIEAGQDLQVVTSSGEYTLYPLENTNSVTKALRIDIDEPFPLYNTANSFVMDRVYIHYRGFTGFDSQYADGRVRLADGTFWSPPSLDGAIVHAADCTSDPPLCHAMLLDMNPTNNLLGSDTGPGYGPHRAADALLYEGQLRDLIKIEIETTSVAPGQSIKVRVDLKKEDKFPGRPAVLGTHKWATVLLDYCDDPGQTDECDARSSFGEMTSYIKTRHNSPVQYISDSSYNKFNVDMDIFGWIQPGVPLDFTSGGFTACFPLDEDRFRIIKEYKPSIKLEDYDGFMYVVRRPKNISCAAGIANGYDAMERTTYTTPEKIVTRVAYMGATIHPDNYSRISSSTLVHEMLHTYGLHHVNAINCDYDQVVDIDGEDCEAQAYGGLFSIMGLRQLASRPNPVNLDNLGWIEAGKEMQIVTLSGEYTLYPLEDSTSVTKVLRIDIDEPFPLYTANIVMDRVYIHYRGFTGFDSQYANSRVQLDDGTFWTPPSLDGVLVHAADCTMDPPLCRAMLLDMNPTHNLLGTDAGPGYGPNRAADALLYNGQYRDLAKLQIETTSVVPGRSITVRVYLGEVPSQLVVSARAQRTRRTAEADAFDWESVWDTVIDFETRFVKDGTNVYQYTDNYLQYVIEAKSQISKSDCPAAIELDAVDSFGGESGNGRALSAWNICTSGPLELFDMVMQDGRYYCAYEASKFQIRLYEGDDISCGDLR